MSKSVPFFATTDDVQSVLSAFELIRVVKYTLTGKFDQPSFEEYPSHSDIEHLGVAMVGDQTHEATYLVSDRYSTISHRVVEQRDGTTKYAIDQLLNPETVTIRPGGSFGEDCIIAGQLGTASAEPESIALFNVLAGEIRRRFRMVKSFRVGREAYRVLENGGRLTIGVRCPREYDLVK